MKRGDQIAYVPDHAKDDGLMYPDTEYGFVNSISPIDSEIIFCRYWHKNRPGQLRTTANSEATNICNLVLCLSVQSDVVKAAIAKIDKEERIEKMYW